MQNEKYLKQELKKQFQKQQNHEKISITPVYYGQRIYLKNLLGQKSFLWGRGFIDKNVYLSEKIQNQPIQSQFTIQPKKGLYTFENKTTTPVVFGSQILLKHVLSEQYIGIGYEDMPTLEFYKEQSPCCYFQFLPLRTFQTNGNWVTMDSIFLIINPQRKLYITDQAKVTSTTGSMTEIIKDNNKDTKDIGRQSIFQQNQDRGVSGSCRSIPNNQSSNNRDNEVPELRFKKKSQIQKTIPATTDSIVRSTEIIDNAFFRKTSQHSGMSPTRQMSTDFPAFQSLEESGLRIRSQAMKDDEYIANISLLIKNLPIYTPETQIHQCTVQNYSYSQWQIELAKTHLKTTYLTNNDYIYFIHSQANETLTLDIQKFPPEISYIKNTSQGENEFILNSIFIVQIQIVKDVEKVYLKHLLTGKYFPFVQNEKQKKTCELIPLLFSKKNQFPPFKILFGGEVFQKKDPGSRSGLHAFFLNKVPKRDISEIMSIQNVNKDSSITHLITYLKQNTRKRQKILREFLYIPKLIHELALEKQKVPSNEHEQKVKQNKIKKCYQLLFFLCRNNEKNKKICLRFIRQILDYWKKQQIMDLLTQLLIDGTNGYIVEKAITPSIIQQQMTELINCQGYSVSFMRIFRVFCGSDQQPSVRNRILLFNIFFWGGEVSEETNMTQSILKAQKKLSLPLYLKFKVFEQEGNIYFSNGNEKKKYQQIDDNVIDYIRQYFYLLSDCMNGDNYPLIRKFTECVSFDLLLKLLEKQKMKSPALALMYNAYLRPQKKYKPYIFHQNYQKICEKGSLIQYCNESGEKLRKFLQKQIAENKRYSETLYRILLNVFKMIIQNGYWKQFQGLIDLMSYLDGVISQPQSDSIYHDTYEEKANDRNLLKSKITAISIKISLIDMQMSLWASNHIIGIQENDEENRKKTEIEIEENIISQIKKTKNWIIDQKILHLCSTNSPQLLRKSILLLYKIYNLYKLTQRTYEQAATEATSKKDLTQFFSTLQQKSQPTPQQYFIIISSCTKDPLSFHELNPKNLSKNNRNLQSLFKYKQMNEQVQNMACKLGLHEQLVSEISRFTLLPKKQKEPLIEITYWKLLGILALIRNHSKLRDIVAQSRKIFILLMDNDTQLQIFYVAVQIIQEFYRNNRKLIISDNQELKDICRLVDKIKKKQNKDMRYCKAVNLLSVFIQTGNRKIGQNYQIILNNVFNKEFINWIKDFLKGQDRKESVQTQNISEYFRHILQIIIYDLLVTMGQKKQLIDLKRPSNQTIYALLLGIGNSNWNLKGKAFLCINFNGIKEKMVKEFLGIILFDLNVMCELIKTNYNKIKQIKQLPKEVKIYISNIIKILDTIQNLFKACVKKLEEEDSQEQVFVIKIVERLFIMRVLCPQIVHRKIDHLLRYINVIEKRMDRKSQFKDLCHILKNIHIADFEKNQIKEKLPLIYSQKIRTQKKEEPKINILDQKNKHVESVIKKKAKIDLKTNQLNKNRFESIEIKLKQLKTLILSLSSLNKTDSSFLSDNIKEFLINFIKISYLESNEEDLTIMQDHLVSYQVPTIVCSILQQPFKHRYKLFCSTFELGIKLLEGGHTKCQQKFLEKFKEDSKNWIFQNIYQIIIDSLATIQFYYHYKEDPTISSYEMVLELQEYYTCKQQRKLSCQLLGNAFRFLQLLCENDNHQMKEYIYNQIDQEQHVKYTSKNFIQLAQRMLDGVSAVIQFNIFELLKMPNPKFEQQVRANIFNLPISILDFLIEVCQIPADQNQLYLCRTDFLDFIRKIINLRTQIMTKFPDSQEKDWTIFFLLERKLIILLRSLLEVNSQEIENLLRKKIGNAEFIFFIEQSFTYGGLEDTQKLQQMLTEMKLNIYVENIVDVLIIRKILKNQTELEFVSEGPQGTEKSQEKKKIVNELNSRIQSIEVDFKTHSLTVYFPFHPLFSFLSKKTKDFILDRSAAFSTRRQKLTQLIISREVIYKDINHEKNSEKRMMNSKKMAYLFNFALIICYLIVLLLVLFYSVGKSGTVLDIYEVQIISGLSYLQFIVACIYATLMGINLFPIAKEKVKAAQALKRRYFNKNHDKVEDFNNNQTILYLKMLKNIYIDEEDSTHALLLLVISTIACFVEVRIYSFALIFAFSKIQLLESILKSLRLTWQQLIFVSLLALAFSFIFGFITLNYYIGPLYQNQQIDIDIDRINQHCNSIITCVGSLYTQKIIGQSVPHENEEYNYGRFVADLLHWGFFQILLSNIIAAIIIDKFAEQRNVKEKILHQKFSKCYICFADRSLLQRRGEDFMAHVNHVHNIWNYFFYMYSLEHLKAITDFTGIQYWINRQIKSGMIQWIPIDDYFREDQGVAGVVQKMRELVEKGNSGSNDQTDKK